MNYYTVKELSEKLKVREATIRTYIKNKKIKAKFEFNKYYISELEVDRLLGDDDENIDEQG